MTDIVERLRGIGTPMGNAIAGYRDRNNPRGCEGLAEIATVALEAADEIERLRHECKRLRALLTERGRSS